MMIELVSFSLLPGYDEKKFIRETHLLIDEFIAKQPGFLGVQFGKNPQNNNWVAIYYWENKEDNDMATQQTRQSTVWKQATAGIDINSVVREQLNMVAASKAFSIA